MKDFKQSYDQKSWEWACDSHARGIKMLDLCKKLNSQKHLEYWEKRIKELEEKYPQLKVNLGE